jgi:hypothetical protein
MFPSYLRKERVLIWGLLSGGILICPWGIAAIRGHKKNTELEKEESEEELAVLEEEEPIEELAVLEEEEPVEELEVLEVEEPVEELEVLEEEEPVEELEVLEEEEPVEELVVLEEEEPVEELAVLEEEELVEELAELEEKEPVEEIGELKEEEPVEELTSFDRIELLEEANWSNEVLEYSLEEIIEKGFQAKEEEHYHLAAEWFIYALSRKPASDIAFYLIVESYQHWQNGFSPKEALNKLSPYINQYLEDAPPDWRFKLSSWLKEEKVFKEVIKE